MKKLQVSDSDSFQLLLLNGHQIILKQVMLRRRKDDIINGKKLIELPQRTVEVISCPFDATERIFYESLENKMDEVLEKLLNKTRGTSIFQSFCSCFAFGKVCIQRVVHLYKLPNGCVQLAITHSSSVKIIRRIWKLWNPRRQKRIPKPMQMISLRLSAKWVSRHRNVRCALWSMSILHPNVLVSTLTPLKQPHSQKFRRGKMAGLLRDLCTPR